jgi:hypothetical protein
MANVRVTFREPRLNVYLNSPGGEVGRFLHRQGYKVLTGARAQVGTRTGALRASLHMRHLADPRGQYVRIGSPLRYALLHHEGTRPHLIRPVAPNRVLRFASKGTVVMTNLVRHPGTKANRYLTDNLKLIRYSRFIKLV